MSQIFHIQKNKENLILRSQIITAMRNFFISQNFIEITAPALISLPGQEPYLDVMSVNVIDERNNKYNYYLHTSPEFTMKKVLGAGFENIFSLGQVYRNKESFGGIHNPEFTMLEWYRKNKNFKKLMSDCEELILHIYKNVPGVLKNKTQKNLKINKQIQKIHMRDLFKNILDINLDDYLDISSMQELCKKLNHNFDKNSDEFEDLFFKIFLNNIEPELGDDPIIIHHYPKQMAALAKIDEQDSLYAERFELYINKIEIANAFSELCDSKEQGERFKQEQIKRKKLNKKVFDIDQNLLSSLDNIESAAGIALGVDRLVQVLIGCKNIDDVLVLPMSKQ